MGMSSRVWHSGSHTNLPPSSLPSRLANRSAAPVIPTLFTGGETESEGSPAAGQAWGCPDVSPLHWDQCRGRAGPRKGRHCLICGCGMSTNKGDEVQLWQCLARGGRGVGGRHTGLPTPHPAGPICILRLCPAVPKPGAFLEKNVKAVEFRRMWRQPLARSAGGVLGCPVGPHGRSPQGNPGPTRAAGGWRWRCAEG